MNVSHKSLKHSYATSSKGPLMRMNGLNEKGLTNKVRGKERREEARFTERCGKREIKLIICIGAICRKVPPESK